MKSSGFSKDFLTFTELIRQAHHCVFVQSEFRARIKWITAVLMNLVQGLSTAQATGRIYNELALYRHGRVRHMGCKRDIDDVIGSVMGVAASRIRAETHWIDKIGGGFRCDSQTPY